MICSAFLTPSFSLRSIYLLLLPRRSDRIVEESRYLSLVRDTGAEYRYKYQAHATAEGIDRMYLFEFLDLAERYVHPYAFAAADDNFDLFPLTSG